jgi:hypothetical protein
MSEDIKPFRVDVPQADLDDLRERLDRTRWPDQIPDTGWDYGVPVDYVKRLADYWRNEYDWRRWEAEINKYPQPPPRSTGRTSTSCTSARRTRTHCR